jgi:hypothetical protein
LCKSIYKAYSYYDFKNKSLAIKSQSEDITVKRLSIIVGKDGYCVGMEVRFTKSEEKVIKKTKKVR